MVKYKRIGRISVRDCFKCGKKGHLAKDCVVKNVKCECGGEHATEKHDAVMKAENRSEEYRAFQEYRAKLKDKDKDKSRSLEEIRRRQETRRLTVLNKLIRIRE